MSESVQLCNRTLALAEGLVGCVHARLEGEGKKQAIAWEARVEADGIKAWESGREPVKAKGLLESGNAFDERVMLVANGVAGNAVLRCERRVLAAVHALDDVRATA